MEQFKKITVNKPWGKFEQFTLNQVCTVKILTVEPYARLSYQSHKNREEFWRCIEGSVFAIIDGTGILMKVNDELLIPLGTKHRLVGTYLGGKVLEISFGEFDEEDIIRYEDDYGREMKSK